MIDPSRSAQVRRRLVSVVLLGAQAGVAVGTSTWSASAQPAAASAPDKEARQRAKARFKDGETLFQKHDYEGAARAFEDAQALAPHPSVLLNAINAHVMAGHTARAATLSAQLVADSRADEKSREEARGRLAELRAKVGRLDLRGAQVQSLSVDGTRAEPGEMFVEPGDHRIEAEVSGRKVERRVTVVAGSSEQILLDTPASATTTTTTATTTATVAPPPPTSGGKGLSPTVTYVGIGLTAILGGITVWSGLDTLSAKRDFDDKPVKTQADKDDGLAKQTRTNVLIGATAVLGVATLGVALFATSWRRDDGREAAWLKVGPGAVTFGGTF